MTQLAQTPVAGSITKYYSFDKIYSFNAVYNFIVGARGLGKTYGAKHKVIRDFLKRGDQFVYVRRYKDELKGRFSFFADLAHDFPDWDFRVNGNTAECAPVSTREDKKRRWSEMGFFLALSQSQSYKSVAYPRVKTIIFDEFIIEKGAIHYMPNEARIFNDLFSTVDRYKDKTRVLFLANSISIMNPYFLEYGIKPDEGGELFTVHGGFIACHFPDSAEFQNEVYATKFGRFISNTEYADYAVGSEFRDDNDHLLELKSHRAQYRYTLETEHGIFTVWHDINTNQYYCQERRPRLEKLLTLMPENMQDGWILCKYNDKILQFLRASFRQGRVYFDNSRTRNAFIEVFRR